MSLRGSKWQLIRKIENFNNTFTLLDSGEQIFDLCYVAQYYFYDVNLKNSTGVVFTLLF